LSCCTPVTKDSNASSWLTFTASSHPSRCSPV
jgi:hypothetical protein